MFIKSFNTWVNTCLKLSISIVLLTSLFLINTLPVHASTDVGGPITTDTVWTVSNSPYIVVASVEVWEGVKLTVEPGVIVKFNSGTKLQVNGELIVQGTDSTPIVFTSNQDSPAPGDWGNIEFTSTAITTTIDSGNNYVGGSIMSHCVVEYGGNQAESVIVARSLMINHCTVQNNTARGIFNVGTEASPSVITNNVISNNSVKVANSASNLYGGGIYAEYSAVIANTVNNISIEVADVSEVFDGILGGGIYARFSSVKDNNVSGSSVAVSRNYPHEANVHGGGIYAEYSSISGNTVVSNIIKAKGCRAYALGGGIYAWDSIVTENIINDNSTSAEADCSQSTANSYGGGLYLFDSMATGNRINGNSAHSSPGYSRGGGVYVVHNSTLTENTVVGNSSSEGGGVYAYAGSDTYVDDNISVTVISNVISENTATYNGGGIYAYAFGQYNASVDVSSNIVHGNITEGNGGGLHIYAHTNAYSCYANANVSGNIFSNC
ncbi:MAG: hypothetical protein ISR58_14950 [Anaerolineales bacterium]|nr:hypothetical protein [Chloroflexota bacterium]MBL6982475.1 hypothetical protein [Anaerolineales bacterium]